MGFRSTPSKAAGPRSKEPRERVLHEAKQEKRPRTPTHGDGGRVFGMLLQNVCLRHDMSLLTACGAPCPPYGSWWSHPPATGSSEENGDLGLTRTPRGAPGGGASGLGPGLCSPLLWDPAPALAGHTRASCEHAQLLTREQASQGAGLELSPPLPSAVL